MVLKYLSPKYLSTKSDLMKLVETPLIWFGHYPFTTRYRVTPVIPANSVSIIRSIMTAIIYFLYC